MEFLKKIFSFKKQPNVEDGPDNTKLVSLLNKYSNNRSQHNYGLVIKELLEGDSFLILPTLNDADETNKWSKSDNNTIIKLTSVFDLDGLKVLGAFSDERSLINWAKGPRSYTALTSQATFDLCKDQNIDRIIINSESTNVFLIERKSNTEILSGRNVVTQIKKTFKQLDNHIIQNLIERFKLNENILEAYQYEQLRDYESSTAIGLKLLSYSDNGKKSALYSVQDALKEESGKLFVDILFLDTDEWYRKVRSIEGARFYSRN